MNEKFVPIQFPAKMEDMLEHWSDSVHETIGWCLLCDGPIHTEANFIAGTNTHDCPAGRAFEAIHSRPEGPVRDWEEDTG